MAELQALQKSDFDRILQKTVQTGLHNGLLAKGLHEVCKTLELTDKKKPKFCVLAEDCDEQQYVKLVKALSKAREIPLITIPQGVTLGEWIGICKYDNQKVVRKGRKCSSLVVKDYSPDISEAERKLIEDAFTK